MTRGQVMKAVAAGAVGAVVLTVLHEITRRRTRYAPRLDIGGMRALARMFRAVDLEPPDRLHRSALVGDLAANAAFYSLAASAGKRSMVAGSLLGLGAGLGAVVLPVPMGIGVGPTDRTRTTQAMSVALYTAGGLVAGAVYDAIR
jgi:hypothetical protein